MNRRRWDERYCWFLVYKTQIQYAFKNREAAITYKEQGHLDYMLLTDPDNITNDSALLTTHYS